LHHTNHLISQGDVPDETHKSIVTPHSLTGHLTPGQLEEIANNDKLKASTQAISKSNLNDDGSMVLV